MTAENWVSLLTALAVVCYGAGFVTACLRRASVSMGLLAFGWGVNGVIVIVNGWLCGEPPFGNMYHVLVFLSLCFLPLYGMLWWRHGLGWLRGYASFASVLPLIGSVFIERDLLWRRVPALQSLWFVPHVVSYMVSYALATIAFLLTVMALFRVWRQRGCPWRAAGLCDIVLDDRTLWTHREPGAAMHILRLAFPFMTFGLLSGALWAEEAWGVYWSWDPKETWSLVTWTLYLVMFHCHLSRSLRRWALPAQVTAFTALLVTFFVVNLLPKLGSILHSYA